MAKRVNIELVDDFDPTKTADQTVEFALDGVTYAMDLSNENADKFRDELDKWIMVARKEGGRRRGRRPATTTTATTPANGNAGLPLADIRAWAKKNGHTVATRGRVSAQIVREYNAAHS